MRGTRFTLKGKTFKSCNRNCFTVIYHTDFNAASDLLIQANEEETVKWNKFPRQLVSLVCLASNSLLLFVLAVASAMFGSHTATSAESRSP